MAFFSAIVAFSTLIFLYSPHPFWESFYSPLLVLTFALLLSILRLIASRRPARFGETEVGPVGPSSCDSPADAKCPGPDPNPIHDGLILDRNARSAEEAIDEEYDGENDGVLHGKRGLDLGAAIERYDSLALCYPETDSDCSSSDGEFTEIGEWRDEYSGGWEEEREEMMIEIKLDWERRPNKVIVEEDNLIEIDLSPNREFCDEFSD
ncbi:unnamed protein product [Cuscuta epithymum]|uniref:Uncharacterized protein n=1 Tax=Cuscuta epithymum TaxID=186058 RepID=A0AAV0E2T2_9ASTE|nr:unnamed protein product [Cuscuta epithymum]